MIKAKTTKGKGCVKLTYIPDKPKKKKPTKKDREYQKAKEDLKQSWIELKEQFKKIFLTK